MYTKDKQDSNPGTSLCIPAIKHTLYTHYIDIKKNTKQVFC